MLELSFYYVSVAKVSNVISPLKNSSSVFSICNETNIIIIYYYYL